MTDSTEDRREFLKRASVLAASFPLLLGCKSQLLAQKSNESVLSLIKKNARTSAEANWSGAIDAPGDVSWQTVVATELNEGEPMIISGTVFQADGKTPAANVLIYFYHTDMFGHYGKKGEHKHGKFRSWLLTGEDGKYEFRSIRPASYPQTTISAHIHMTLTGVDFKEDWIDSILFEGDRFISAREREMAGKKGGFQPIVTLEKGTDGILRGTRDIQLLEA